MSTDIKREKLYEALAFFAANVKYAGQLKLFKLLYYLDLMHFRRTGMTVTGLTYQAWPMGPVPTDLNEEFEDKCSELQRRFDVQKHRRLDEYVAPTIDTPEEELEGRSSSGARFVPGSLTPKRSYKHLYLTRREQRLAEQLAEIFRDATAAQMSDISHHKFGPWRKALHRAKQTGISRPEIDLMEGVVACGNKTEELPPDELRQVIAERARIEEALR